MLGLFDSGYGGMTLIRDIQGYCPGIDIVYYGDHQHAPYGNLSHDQILEYTHAGVEKLFDQGCNLVILACNTATAVACRTLQQEWLPGFYSDKNVLGIIAPTIEAVTQTPWHIQTPQSPQKFNQATVGVFATRTTVQSNVYVEEIHKRCPEINVFQQPCPNLAGAIEAGTHASDLEAMVQGYVETLLRQVHTLDYVILGCTHYPLVKNFFLKFLPKNMVLIEQSNHVAQSLATYINRHSEYDVGRQGQLVFLGDKNAEHMYTTKINAMILE